MGVLGLWDILDSVGHPIKIEGLEGKVLGVDANIWLYKFIRGFREKDNATNIESHKLGLFNRVSKLLYYRIKPVFVFDGQAPVLKRRTLERRQNTRNKHLMKVQDAAMKILASHLKSQYPDAEIDHLKITMPKLMSNNLVAAEKLTEDDRDLFYLPDTGKLRSGDSDSDDSLTQDILDNHQYMTAEVDVNSKDFEHLPAETRYEILQDIKQSRKRIRNPEILPEDANSFSNFQLERLKARRTIQEKIEKCEKEICTNYTGELADGSSIQAFRVQSDAHATILYRNNTYDPKALEKVKQEEDAKVEEAFKKVEDDKTKMSVVKISPEPENGNLKCDDSVSKDILDDHHSVTTEEDSCKDIEHHPNDISCEILYEIRRSMKQISNTKDLPEDVNSLSESEQEDVENNDEAEKEKSGVEKSSELDHLTSNNLVETEKLSGRDHDPSCSPLIGTLEDDEDESEESVFQEVIDDQSREPEASTCSKDIEHIPADISCEILYEIKQPRNQMHDPENLFQDANSTSNQKAKHDKEEEEDANVETINAGISLQPNLPASESLIESQTLAKKDREPTCLPETNKSKHDNGRSEINVGTSSQNHFRPPSPTRTNKVTNKIVEDAKELLRLFGIPYIDAAGEAEAQCAKLEELKLTEGTITDDSDIWLFGSQNVYRYFFNDDKYVMQYKMTDIEFHVRMTRENLVCFAMLVGSDYTDGIMNVGPVTALEVLSEFPGESMEPLVQFRDWHREAMKDLKAAKKDKKRRKLLKYRLPDEFPSRAVYDGYLRPIADTSTEKFTWGTPELDELREYARRNFGWDPKKIDEKLVPVMKRLNEKKVQKTIDTFFFKTQANRNPEMFRSKRVNQALNKIAKRAALDEKVSVPEVVNLSEDEE